MSDFHTLLDQTLLNARQCNHHEVAHGANKLREMYANATPDRARFEAALDELELAAATLAANQYAPPDANNVASNNVDKARAALLKLVFPEG